MWSDHRLRKAMVLGVVALFIVVNVPFGQSLNQTVSSNIQTKETSQSFSPKGELPFPLTGIVYVDDDFNSSTPGWGVDHFSRIQDGIDTITENGTVYVYNGTYVENVNINTNGIKLLGEQKDTTIIDGNGTGDAISVYASEVNISGFTVQNGTGNNQCGIVIWNTSNNSITSLNIRNNNVGINEQGSCNNNWIYHNNFYFNTFNALDYSLSINQNHWDNGHDGNYWSDYTGQDNNHDGIGDTPYNISGGSNQDLYPLITPYGRPHADFATTITGRTVTFNASFSYDYDGMINSYAWDFGDGTNSTGIVVNHTYANYGNDTVTLTVMDTEGNIDSISKLISVVDLTPPNIVDNTPSIGYAGNPFTFNATITDDAGVVFAFVYFWYDSGNVTVLPLNNAAGDYWNASIYIENTLGIMTYYIATTDFSGNFNSTEPKNVTILDNDAPTFIDSSPTYGTTGDPYTFTVTASDNIDVATVTVTWTHGHLGGTNISLIPDGNGTWSLTITLDNNLSAMTYTITVTDTSNNYITGPQQTVQVSDNDKPVIVDNTPTVAQAGDPFTFNATITDNIQVNGTWVDYWVDNGTHTNTTMTPVGGTLWQKTITLSFTSVILHYFISAEDTSRNWQQTGIINVSIVPNYPPVTPQPPTGPTIGKMNVEYNFTISTSDPNGEKVYYQWDWGDGSTSQWYGPFNSNEQVAAGHIWSNRGVYQIKVKAKDIHSLETNWSDPLTITLLGPAILIGLTDNVTLMGDYYIIKPLFMVGLEVSPLNLTFFWDEQIIISKNDSSGFIGKKFIIGVFYEVGILKQQLQSFSILTHFTPRLHQRHTGS